MGPNLSAPLLSLACLSFLASALRPRSTAQEGRTVDLCACKNWMQTYARGAVRCGTTNEFYPSTKRRSMDFYTMEYADQLVGEQYCTHFFEALDDNACVNMNIGEDAGQWCYVDADCENLAGGALVNFGLAWKKCSAGKDKLLRDYDPKDLEQLALANGLEIGLTNKMAYPVSAYKWKYVSAFWDADLDSLSFAPGIGLSGMTAESLKEELRPRWGKRHRAIDDNVTADLQRIVDSGVPTAFDTSKDKNPPYVIVKGRAVFITVPGTPPTVVCLAGCGPAL